MRSIIDFLVKSVFVSLSSPNKTRVYLMKFINRFTELLSVSFTYSLLFLAVGVTLCQAQTASGTNVCPIAEKLIRSSELLQLNCDYRLSVVQQLNTQDSEVQAAAERGDITAKQSRIYAAEVKSIANQTRVAQRSANLACRAVELRLGTAERAQTTCDSTLVTSTTN